MFNLNLVKSFIKHQLKANTLHGTHSPFVYKFLEQVVYDIKPKPSYTNIEQYRTKLLQDTRVLLITDLGAGSHVNNNKKKVVKDLAAAALKPAKWAQLIYRIVAWQNPKQILELGTCLGITSSYLLNACKSDMTTIEGCPETAKIANETISALSSNNYTLQVGNFDNLLPEYLSNKDKVDFIYFDGNHRKDATLSYFYQSLEKVHKDTIFIFDDIHWSKGMEEAWDEIKNNPKVTITIDLFNIGLVFFKEGQKKEDFIIKY